MPLLSMTGFGRREGSHNGQSLTLEIRSVNNRYLEISCKLPRNLVWIESSLRTAIRTRLTRGSVTCTVSQSSDSSAETALAYNVRLVEDYLNLARTLAEKHAIPGRVELAQILALPDLLQNSESTNGDDAVAALVLGLAHEALDDLLRMREQEGTTLKSDLSERVQRMDSMVVEIAKLEPGRVIALKERYQIRLKALLEDAEVDPVRLIQEVGMMVERLDISEEITRFRSHCTLFLNTLAEPANQGKKLNFILQEMTREANTLGTKCQDAAISALAVQLKDEVETIREQVQNIE